MRTIAGTTWLVEGAREYIRARVKVDERGCWIWQKSAFSYGYPQARISKRWWATRTYSTTQAHRLAYEAFKGPVQGLQVLHECDVPMCCNPNHLFLGDHKANMADMNAKGRHGWTKLDGSQVDEIRRMLAEGVLQRVIADRFGVSQGHISDIKRGRRR